MIKFPQKLVAGDKIGVIAASRSLEVISENVRNIANKNFQEIGLTPIYSNYANEKGTFSSSSIEHRVADIHDMFQNKEIKAILTAIGGYNSNQLLKYIDWKIIHQNPKIFCGFSDSTVLANAIFSMTGLVTYIGPHYSTLGQKHYIDYTLEYFKKCTFKSIQYQIRPSDRWRDDEWWIKQDDVNLIENTGPLVVNQGLAQGISVGGNLSSLVSLCGTKYFPDLSETLLFIEVTGDYGASKFDNELQTLLLQKMFNKVRGLLIGRFQRKSRISEEDIKEIIKAKKELEKIPVIANLDFGHTTPMFTFPIGGEIRLAAKGNKFTLQIIKH